MVTVYIFPEARNTLSISGKVSELQDAAIPGWWQAPQLCYCVLEADDVCEASPAGWAPLCDPRRVRPFRHQPKVSSVPYGATPLLQLTSAPSSSCTIILPPHMSIHLLGSCYAACQIGFSKKYKYWSSGICPHPDSSFYPSVTITCAIQALCTSRQSLLDHLGRVIVCGLRGAGREEPPESHCLMLLGYLNHSAHYTIPQHSFPQNL